MTAMGSFSIWHWMLFGAVALLLFGGKGKISDIMGDVAKGVKSFKKGMADDDEAPAPRRRPSSGRSRTASASTPTTFTRSAERVLEAERLRQGRGAGRAAVRSPVR